VRAQKAASRKVTVVHHIDADGVSAAAIATAALDRAGVANVPFAAKSLDAAHCARIAELGADALWFCDLGSTVYMQFPSSERLVCDHHQLVRDGSEESFPHVNPLLDGLSGEEISGAGCAYLVAAALGPANLDLLPLALVGASGDLQDRKLGRFTGANGTLVEHGAQAGILEVRDDLRFFGASSRRWTRHIR
jgi:RecJ-like exonuclease